jgi:hypothetical protein
MKNSGRKKSAKRDRENEKKKEYGMKNESKRK